jgi:hypothetical protein
VTWKKVGITSSKVMGAFGIGCNTGAFSEPAENKGSDEDAVSFRCTIEIIFYSSLNFISGPALRFVSQGDAAMEDQIAFAKDQIKCQIIRLFSLRARGYTGIYRDIPGYHRAYPWIIGHSDICPDIRRHGLVYPRRYGYVPGQLPVRPEK